MSETNLPGDDWDDGALNDPLLRRALASAPDHAMEPEPQLRQSIRVLAHEAVAPSLPEGLVGAERPWWQRLLGIGGGGASRMPWNAAFATVLVGVLVTVMWQREPVPGAEPDRPMQDRNVASAPAPTPAAPSQASPPAPVAPAAPARAPKADASAPPSALDAALAESRAVTEASNRALDAQDRERERLAKEAVAARAATAAAESAAEKALQKALASEQAKEQAKALAQRQAAPVAPSAEAPAAPPPPSAPSAFAGAPRASGLSVPPSAPQAPSAEAPTPTFEALSQWAQMRITRSGGASRSLPRDEARELGALVGSAALSGVGTQPFTGAVDWRIGLERNGRVLAVLELAGGQVSWREGSLPAATGRPGTDALSALRQALEEAAR